METLSRANQGKSARRRKTLLTITFVVRDGKIVAQSFTGRITPKT
jgi:hypothetical protein